MIVVYGSRKRKAGNCFNCGQPGQFAQDCFKQKQKQKSTKGHHHAKKAEEQEDTDSEANEMFIATVGLRADHKMIGSLTQVPVDT